MALPELEALSDAGVNLKVVETLGWRDIGPVATNVARLVGRSPQFPSRYDPIPPYATDWTAIIGAVRAWANGDGEREAAILNALPTADRTIRAMVLFDLAPRDLCHALILASETK